MTDQETGEIVGLFFGGEFSGEGKCTHTEDVRQHSQVSSCFGNLQSKIKRFGKERRALFESAPEYRVLAKNRIHFAGHERLEVPNRCAVHERPFRVRARQADPNFFALVRWKSRERSEDLSLLAPHDVHQFSPSH